MAVPAPFLVLCAFAWGFCHVEATPDTLSSLDSSFCHGDLEVIYPQLVIDKCLIIPKDGKLREKISTVWKAPQIYFPGAQKKKMYVLVMVDPDAPSRTKPTAAFWRHWLVVNVQGSALKRGQIQGTTVTETPLQTPDLCGLSATGFASCERRVRTANINSTKTLFFELAPGPMSFCKRSPRAKQYYHPPTPPQKSGFHRYQFMLFEQPPDAPVSLTEQEKTSRGKWGLQAFVKKFDLGKPVAALQFLTQNYKD